MASVNTQEVVGNCCRNVRHHLRMSASDVGEWGKKKKQLVLTIVKSTHTCTQTQTHLMLPDDSMSCYCFTRGGVRETIFQNSKLEY